MSTAVTTGKRAPSPVHCEFAPKRSRFVSVRCVGLRTIRSSLLDCESGVPVMQTPTTPAPVVTPTSSGISGSKADRSTTNCCSVQKLQTSTLRSVVSCDTSYEAAVNHSLRTPESHTQVSPVSDSCTPPGSSAPPVSTSPLQASLINQPDQSTFSATSASTKNCSAHSDVVPESPVLAPQATTVKVEPDTDDHWDTDGHCKICNGEILNDRYVVTGVFGDGIYSRVLRASDTYNNNRDVAIKCHRLNTKRAAQSEKKILELINDNDPGDSAHCIRLLDSFEDQYGTLCLVFEAMGSNLRQVLHQYKGKSVNLTACGSSQSPLLDPQSTLTAVTSASMCGLPIRLVSRYTRSMLLALRHLKSLSLVHCDIKLDNVLLSSSSPLTCKLADFGCAVNGTCARARGTMFARFYRPPESILGAPVCASSDMWALGCCVYELATSRFSFSGATNSEMLWLHMQVTGRPSHKVLRQYPKSANYFDSAVFRTPPTPSASDVAANTLVQQFMTSGNATRDIKSEIMRYSTAVKDPLDKALYIQLADLLAQIFVFEPSKRIKVEEALSHPFAAVLDNVCTTGL